MAHLKTKETHNQPPERKVWKFQLMTMLSDRGYGEPDILELHNFLDWMMNLPEELERQFQRELADFEEARHMKYVTTIERMAEARGEARGQVSGERSLVLKLLTRKLGSIPDRALEQINTLSITQLEALGEALLDFATIDDLKAWLQEI